MYYFTQPAVFTWTITVCKKNQVLPQWLLLWQLFKVCSLIRSSGYSLKNILWHNSFDFHCKEIYNFLNKNIWAWIFGFIFFTLVPTNFKFISFTSYRRRLSCRHNTHLICFNYFDIVFFTLNKVKKKSKFVGYRMWKFSYIFIQRSTTKEDKCSLKIPITI